MLRLTSAAIFVLLMMFAALPRVTEAKGPFRAVLSGGDLPAPVTLDEPIEGTAMFGDGVQMNPPLPFPRYIYTLEVYPDGAEDGGPAETIYYYPAHDGLPAAFRTSYGFFAVAERFDAVLQSLLPSRQADDSANLLWYVSVGLAVALVAAALAGRAVMSARSKRRAAALPT
jgi:hypothetical protein